MKIDVFQTKLTPFDRNVMFRVMMPDAYTQNDRLYPVLNIYDGQDVFRDEDSFSGHRWQKKFSLFMQAILCSIRAAASRLRAKTPRSGNIQYAMPPITANNYWRVLYGKAQTETTKTPAATAYNEPPLHCYFAAYFIDWNTCIGKQMSEGIKKIAHAAGAYYRQRTNEGVMHEVEEPLFPHCGVVVFVCRHCPVLSAETTGFALLARAGRGGFFWLLPRRGRGAGVFLTRAHLQCVRGGVFLWHSNVASLFCTPPVKHQQRIRFTSRYPQCG